jgi:hypothetical protein
MVIIATVLFSCSKQEPASVQNPPGSSSRIFPPTDGINYLSKWVTLPFEIITDRQSSWLQADFMLPRARGYNYTKHKQFVFIRYQRRNTNVYASLPAIVTSVDGDLEFDYGANPTGFVVTIKNSNPSIRWPNLLNFHPPALNYRFLVVTDSTYRAHNIDWTDYDQVAGALRGSIWFD